MRVVSLLTGLLLFAGSLPTVLASDAHELIPASCTGRTLSDAASTPLASLRARAEAEILTDPTGTVALLCVGFERALDEFGPQAAESGWWALSLAMPLIAFMDQHTEAEPLLQFALPVFERELGPTAPEVAEVHVAWAWIHFRRGRLADCEAEWTRALAIREIVPGERQIELQKVLVGLAQVRLSRRDSEGTELALDRAQAILVANGETVSDAAAAIENVYTNLFLRREDFARARVHAERQIEIESQLPAAAANPVPPRVLLGRILERLDEFEASERIMREAVAFAEAAGGTPQRYHLTALLQLARLLNERGKPAEALPFAERAREVGIATVGAEAPAMVAVLDGLAEVQRSVGAWPESLDAYQGAAALVERHAEDVEKQVRIAHHRGLGDLWLDIGDIGAARQEVAAGLAAVEGDTTLSVEWAQLLAVRARGERGEDPAVARLSLHQALELLHARLPPGHPRIVRILNELCAIELDLQVARATDCDRAQAGIDAAEAVDPALRSAAWINLSRRAALGGNLQDAYDYAIEAVATAATVGTPEPTWRAALQLGTALHLRQDFAMAILMGKRAIAALEHMRQRLAQDDVRRDRHFLHAQSSTYRSVADWLLEAERIDEALEIIALLKVNEFEEFALRASDPAHAGVELTAAEQSLSVELDHVLGAGTDGAQLAQLIALREKGRLSVQEQQRLSVLLDARTAQESDRRERVRVLLEDREPPRARGVARAALRRVARIERQIDAVHLRLDIGRLLDSVTSRRDVTRLSQRLYASLLQPIDEAARSNGASRLVLWLDGALRYVPFSLLDDGRGPIVERYAVQLYSDPLDGQSLELASQSETRVRGLGVTGSVAGYRPLPAVADELCYVIRGPIAGLTTATRVCPEPQLGAGAFEGAGYADLAFTEARLRDLLGGPDDFSILHLGTHFSLRPGNAMRSYLVLGDGNRLTLDRIGTLDFRGIELVTLSACQTGAGGAVTDDGREIEGLSAVVQRHGAARVVASLWQVEDASTAELMRAMYAAMAAQQLDVAAALRAAQQTLRADERYAHPYYWAGFQVTGARR